MESSQYIYVVIEDDNEWEDLIIFIDENSAKEYSKLNTDKRVEIFVVSDDHKEYTKTYNFYKNGILYMT